MRVTHKGRYAVRILVDIALNGGAPMSRRELAARQGIPPDYLAQILKPLRAAGLVAGVKGPGGGYALARDAAEIRIGEVLRAADGPIALTECTIEGTPATCRFIETCRSRSFWEGLSRIITDYADAWTIADLCDIPLQARTQERPS